MSQHQQHNQAKEIGDQAQANAVLAQDAATAALKQASKKGWKVFMGVLASIISVVLAAGITGLCNRLDKWNTTMDMLPLQLKAFSDKLDAFSDTQAEFSKKMGQCVTWDQFQVWLNSKPGTSLATTNHPITRIP